MVIVSQNKHPKSKKEYYYTFSALNLHKFTIINGIEINQFMVLKAELDKFNTPQYPKLHSGNIFIGVKLITKSTYKYNTLINTQQRTLFRPFQNLRLETPENRRRRLYSMFDRKFYNMNTRLRSILNQILKLRAAQRTAKASEVISGTSDAFSRAWNINSIVLKSKIRLATADNQKTEFQIGAKIGDVDDSSF